MLTLSSDGMRLISAQNMKKTGNLASNRRYNPKQQKPNIPIDADEVDGAMERFIREKYQHKTLCGEGRPLPSIKHHTGSSSGSSNDIPPPLPAKNGPPRFTPGMRSSSATFPQTSNALPSPPASDFSSNGSRRMAGIPEDGPPSRDHSFDNKLDTLKEMGFPNESRNSTILQGTGGSVDKAVETLVRLGEGHGTARSNVLKSSQTNGISFESPAVSQASTGTSVPPTTLQHTQSASNTSNPFNRPPAAPIQQPQQTGLQAFEQSFQNMSISQPHTQSQVPSLFPNNTGSWTGQQPANAAVQTNPFMKTFTPPVSPSPYQYHTATQTSNPFLRTAQSQTFSSSNPFGTAVQQPVQAPQSTPMTNWNQPVSAVNGYSATQAGQPQHQQQSQMQQTYVPQQSMQASSPTSAPMQPLNPFGQSQQSVTYLDPNQQQALPQTYSYNQAPNHIQPQQYQNFTQPSQFYGQTYPQQRPFQDKNSILALYNTPSPTNQAPYQQQQPQDITQQNFQQAQTYVSQTEQPPQPPIQPAQRSVTMPIMSNSNSNPFTSSTPAKAQTGHVSRESMAFTVGRSASPDAFSGLSSQWR